MRLSTVQTASSQVPSKLILCGEHAVLYGMPALSMAIQLPTECRIHWQPLDPASPKNPYRLRVELPDFAIFCDYDRTQWQDEIQQIEQRFNAHQQDKTAVQGTVLTHPAQLILLCLARLHRLQTLPEGFWQIRIQSDNWIGRGMGSSAAVILATLKSAYKLLHLSPNDAELLQLATEIESYQHGRSSGLDPATLLAKTVIEFRMPAQIRPLDLQRLPMPAWLIDTGEPQSSTGMCVNQVRRDFAGQSPLWAQFGTTVEQLKQAWQTQNKTAFSAAIRRNQQLLETIGVVPLKVSKFITQLNALEEHACAKVCGAGSVSGDAAGVVIYFGEQSPTQLCQENGYKLQELRLYDCAEEV